MEKNQTANNRKTENKSTKSILKIVGNVFFYVAITIIIIAAAIGIIGKIKGKVGGLSLFGYNAYVVTSSSMAAVNPNHFRKNDIKALGDTQFVKGELVIVKNIPDDYEIKDLDVVTFVDQGYVIIHRIVKIDNSGERTFYTTQGDANNVDDGQRTRDEFLGVMVGSLGKTAGTIVMFIQSGWGIAAVAITIAIILVVTLINDDGKKKQQPKPIEPPDEEEPSENPNPEDEKESEESGEIG